MSTRLTLLVLVVLFLAGCERGCLRRKIDELVGPALGGGSPLSGAALPREAMCPVDLARCSDGRVRAAAPLPPDVPCSPEGCPCPWEDLGGCVHGCVVEGLELDVGREHARAQLCAPAPGAVFALSVPLGSLAAEPAPVGPAEGSPTDDDDERGVDIACAIERYRCDRGVVFRCEGGKLSVFRCLNDCAEEGSAVLVDVTAEQAAALLCRR